MLHVLASNPLQPLIDLFKAVLVFFHDSVGLQWGTAIIALTILVRALLLPLTFKQFHSMQRLAHLQPEIKKLQERFKGDKERLNQEMMGFYRENKVNPFASCLPMVAQFPVFISLYYMLRTDLRREICPEINGPGTAHYHSPIPCGSGSWEKVLYHCPKFRRISMRRTSRATGTPSASSEVGGSPPGPEGSSPGSVTGRAHTKRSQR